MHRSHRDLKSTREMSHRGLFQAQPQSQRHFHCFAASEFPQLSEAVWMPCDVERPALCMLNCQH